MRKILTISYFSFLMLIRSHQPLVYTRYMYVHIQTCTWFAVTNVCTIESLHHIVFFNSHNSHIHVHTTIPRSFYIECIYLSFRLSFSIPRVVSTLSALLAFSPTNLLALLYPLVISSLISSVTVTKESLINNSVGRVANNFSSGSSPSSWSVLISEA